VWQPSEQGSARDLVVHRPQVAFRGQHSGIHSLDRTSQRGRRLGHPDPMDLSGLLRAARAEAGLTQAQVAQRAGVTAQSLSRWECGTRPVRSDDADRALAACGRDVRFSLVLRHTDTDELLAQLAGRSLADRVAALDVVLPGILQDLQATGLVRFSGAWAAAALGLPPLHRIGGLQLPGDAVGQARVAAVLRPWNPMIVENGQVWAANWDDQVFQRDPTALWATSVLGSFRTHVVPDGLEHRVVVEGQPWRVVDPSLLVPADVAAAVLDRWRRLAT
jgi:transcriptional regulator with XRE-family HTH domain